MKTLCLNHLKKSSTGTIGKLSDKITEEEKLEASETNLQKQLKKSEEIKEPISVKSADKTVEKCPENESETKSGFMGFLRGKPKTSEEDKDNSSLSSETESEIETSKQDD